MVEVRRFLFSFFINSMPMILNSQCHLYANDVGLYSGFRVDRLNSSIFLMNNDWSGTVRTVCYLTPASLISFFYNQCIDNTGFDSI